MANWQKKADKEWSRVIRGVGYCEMCGRKDSQLHPHHIIGRTKLAYRHDLSNGVCLCASCHTFARWSAHADRSFFYKWLRQNRKGQWLWFVRHTVRGVKEIGNTKTVTYKPINSKHRGDEAEHKELKEIK